MSRTALLAKIHIGKKQLGLDDSIYRAMLGGRYGVDSSARLNQVQLRDLVEYFKSQGAEFKSPKSKYYRVPGNVPYARQKRYIAGLWVKLGWNAEGLDTRAKKQFGVEKFIWINDETALQKLAKDLFSRCKQRSLEPEPW